MKLYYRKSSISYKPDEKREPNRKAENYFFLCLFFRKRFLRLCVAILCLFLFFPLGILRRFIMCYLTFTLPLTSPTKVLAGLKAGIL
jgi:hypothetical protein